MSTVKRKVRLPQLKATTRQVGKPVVHRLVPRGYNFEDESKKIRIAFSETESEDEAQDGSLDTSAMSECSPIDDTESGLLPSLHEIKQKASVTGWSTLRSALLSAITENSSIPQNQVCALCPAVATFRCVQCGPCVYYCDHCLRDWHSRTNIFHLPEEWKVIHSIHIAAAFIMHAWSIATCFFIQCVYIGWCLCTSQARKEND